jgi:hypothetical protein
MTTNLQKIPGVGSSIEKGFKEIGIDSIEDLRGKNPEVLYGTASKPQFLPIFSNFSCDFLKKVCQYAVFMHFFQRRLG